MVRNGESSETMIPVVIETRDDIRSGVSSLEIGRTQMSVQRARVTTAVVI